MRILLIVLAFFAPLAASNLLTYNIYERSDRIDVMLSFDAPYAGNIFQKRENNTTMLIFDGLNFDQAVDKNLNSKILQELYIEPKQNSVILSIKSDAAINVNASKTTDGFGLRVRVTAASLGLNLTPPNTAQTTINDPQIAPLSDSQSLPDARYFMVLGVLALLCIVLFFVKNAVKKRGTGGGKGANLGSWLIKDKDANVEILHERYLDRLNKVVLINHKNKKYLVLVGSSNVLLDKFGEEKIESEEDFQAFFEENKRKLGQYLQSRQTQLGAYKDKASLE